LWTQIGKAKLSQEILIAVREVGPLSGHIGSYFQKPFLALAAQKYGMATNPANLCPIEFDAAKSGSRSRTTILHNNAGGLQDVCRAK
jgi:hypothetical protein